MRIEPFESEASGGARSGLGVRGFSCSVGACFCTLTWLCAE